MCSPSIMAWFHGWNFWPILGGTILATWLSSWCLAPLQHCCWRMTTRPSRQLVWSSFEDVTLCSTRCFPASCQFRGFVDILGIHWRLCNGDLPVYRVWLASLNLSSFTHLFDIKKFIDSLFMQIRSKSHPHWGQNRKKQEYKKGVRQEQQYFRRISDVFSVVFKCQNWAKLCLDSFPWKLLAYLPRMWTQKVW